MSARLGKVSLFLRRTGSLRVIAAVAMLGVVGCSREERSVPRATAALDGGRIVVAGARPLFPANATPVAAGFLETVRWDESIQTLQCKGWVPLDVRGEAVRFILRDPFDQLRLQGTPLFTPQERPDVAAALPDQADAQHAGFTASIRLTNTPGSGAWTDTVELYCLDPAGKLYRLARTDAPARHTWDRRGDRFEAVLTYAAPELAAPEDSQGSLDVVEPGPAPETVRLAGWAPFDGAAPQSVLIVQLAPALAPASFIGVSWTARPDVRAAIDPQREELDRCGFEVILRYRGAVDDLRHGHLALWSIDAGQNAHRLGLPALKRK